MVCAVKVVVDGFRNADDVALVAYGLQILADFVASVHTVVSAVVEEVADVIFFEHFQNTFVVGVVHGRVFELVAH